MLDWLSPDNPAITMLKEDHDKVKGLFDQFEGEESETLKERIIEEALTELKVHAAIEEEIFYPAVRKTVGTDKMDEADEEHHVAKLLIAELENGKRGDDHRDAKFMVLAENVRHHIKEEENEMLPKAKDARVDFKRLGAEMQARKEQLKLHGVPMAAEERLIANNPKSDSPAAAAKRTATRKAASNGRTATAKSKQTKPKTKTAGGKTHGSKA